MKEDKKTNVPGAPPVEDTEAANNPVAPKAPKDVETESDDPKTEAIAKASSEAIEKDVGENKKDKPARNRNLLSRWWHNKKLRWATIITVLVIIIGLGAYPTTRYVILNTAGVRSSASVTVIDQASQQPLKNVKVQLNNASGTTNDDGYVKLEEVRLGDTKLVVQRTAFAPLEKDITVGWGSNPLGQVVLEPKGIQYTFIVKDFLSGKPLEKIEASSGEASAFSDKKGKIILTLDTTSDEPVKITIKGQGYKTEKLTESAEGTTDKEVKMVASQQQAFISKRSGTYDLYKIYANGTGEELVLEGTGFERDDIVLVPQPTGDSVALVSTRDGARSSDGNLQSALNIVNLSNDKVTKLDSADRIQPVGWIENTLIYIVVTEQTTPSGAKKQRLVSYNVETGQKLDITSATYFNSVIVAGDKVYYAPSIEAAADGSTDNTKVGFYMSDVSGINITRLLDQEVWNMIRTGYSTIALTTGKDWYDYSLGDTKVSRSSGAPADQNTRVYTNNASNKQSLWVDQRDGRGVLLSYDLSTKKDKILASQSGLNYPVRWLNDTTAVYRVNNDNETADYAVSINGGDPKKIVDVTNTSGIDSWYYY